MSIDIYLVLEAETGNPKEPTYRFDVFYENTTHNVVALWRHLGIFEILYESDGKKVGEKGEALSAALLYMKEHKEELRKFDAPNGWGTYETSLDFLESVANAFLRFPAASIRISR